MNETVLRTFPSTRAEALTMLYLQSQDLSNVSPEDLVHLYKEVNKRIREAFIEKTE